MKKQEYVLFNNYDYSENYASAREWLFASRQDDFDWETENDVPEKMILDEMSFLEDSEWAYFKSKCEELLSDGVCLLTGVCGRWNGPARGGKFIHNFHASSYVVLFSASESQADLQLVSILQELSSCLRFNHNVMIFDEC